MKRRKKILLIDDDMGILESLKESLKNNYSVATAGSGEEALAFFKKETPSVIILDIKLGGIDGLETLKAIKNINGSVPVIMLSAVSTVNTIIKSVKLGAYDYFDKPFDVYELKKTIKEAIVQYHDKTVSGNDALPMDIEIFIKDIVNDMVSDKVHLRIALQKFNKKYIDFIFGKFKNRIDN